MRLVTKTNAVLATIGFLLLWLINLPLRVYSLFRTHETFHGSSLAEIRILRLGLLLAAVSVAVGLLVWVLSGKSAWRKAIEQDYASFSESDAGADTPGRGSVLICFVVLLAVFLGLLQTIRWSFIYGGQGLRWYDTLVWEDGVWETLTAVALLMAGVVLVLAGLRFRKRFDTRLSFLVPLFLGFLYLVAAGEELSWGQRWLGFQTPGSMHELNVQGEFNLHNVGGYWANNMMMLYFLGYVGLLPLLALFFMDVRYLEVRLAVPLGPVVFVPYAIVGVLLDERGALNRLWGSPPWRLSEARETLFSVVVLCIAALAFRQWHRRFREGENESG